MKSRMRSSAAAVALGVSLSLFSVFAHAAGEDSFNIIEKGRYLATLGDCAACHTAKGGKTLAGGVPIDTPFGRLVGANITPDNETGIGKWTFDDFQKVMSEGHSPDNKRLYGAMPYTAYTKVTKQDNRAIFAYLKSLDPIHSKVKTNQLPFPFNVRASLIAWNAMNFKQGVFKEDPHQSAEWNRGAYIVQGLAHCATCHTPKNALGGDKNGVDLRGSVVQDWLAPDITNNTHSGIGSWSIAEITQYLKTGSNDYDTASGPMAEEIEHSSQNWDDADLHAVAVYLKTVPGSNRAPPSPIDATSDDMVTGKAVYLARCAACHIANGKGQAQLFPRLASAPLVNNADATSLIRVVLAGSRAGTTDAAPTGPSMPSFAWNLSDDDVAHVLTYVRNSWGNSAPAVTADKVKSLRADLMKH